MNRPGKGKIARLPGEVREQLNLRMHAGERGKPLVQWLNSHPGVCAVVAHEFAGEPVSEQNLSQWRKRGYREWLAQQQAAEAVGRVITGSTELQKSRAEITDNVAVWLAARYVVAAQGMEEQEGGLDWQRMREFCDDLVKLRRGDHSSARIALTSGELQARGRRMAIKELKTLEHCSNISPRAKDLFGQLTAEIAAHREQRKSHDENPGLQTATSCCKIL